MHPCQIQLQHVVAHSCQTIVESARDTDVLLLLIMHSHHIHCKDSWMMSRTAKKRKYINIRTLHDELHHEFVPALLPYHALTGCDSTSYFFGRLKQSSWKCFQQNYSMLAGLEKGELTDERLISAEKSVCRMYNFEQVDSPDKVRCLMFFKKYASQKLCLQ